MWHIFRDFLDDFWDLENKFGLMFLVIALVLIVVFFVFGYR